MYFFSPVCVRLCRANSSDLANLLSQSSQEQVYGFSPVCVRTCAFRCELLKYIFEQGLYGQQNGLGRSSFPTEGGRVPRWEMGGVKFVVLTLSALGVVRTGTMGI